MLYVGLLSGVGGVLAVIGLGAAGRPGYYIGQGDEKERVSALKRGGQGRPRAYVGCGNLDALLGQDLGRWLSRIAGDGPDPEGLG